jgi:hypothetical protein
MFFAWSYEKEEKNLCSESRAVLILSAVNFSVKENISTQRCWDERNNGELLSQRRVHSENFKNSPTFLRDKEAKNQSGM